MADFLVETSIGYAYWPLNGEDSYGILDEKYENLKDTWRLDNLNLTVSTKGRFDPFRCLPVPGICSLCLRGWIWASLMMIFIISVGLTSHLLVFWFLLREARGRPIISNHFPVYTAMTP